MYNNTWQLAVRTNMQAAAASAPLFSIAHLRLTLHLSIRARTSLHLWCKDYYAYAAAPAFHADTLWLLRTHPWVLKVKDKLKLRESDAGKSGSQADATPRVYSQQRGARDPQV